MRPLELTVRGFQSYASGQTFDFRHRRLVGIVGPIGSGKSSLLDGIAFALYGKTPRAGRGTRDLINQRGQAAHVELWFDIEGETWRAVRALRRRGQSAHNLYRHASADPESERLEEVTGERAMTARIEQLLGLDFDAFNRSVFLAQYRFAEFLQATPVQRDAVLEGVFNLDLLRLMQAEAKKRRDGYKAELADLERLRTEVAADRLALEEAIPARDQAAIRLADLEAAHERAAELERGVAVAQREVERSERRLAELSDVAAQLPARERSAELLERAATGSELLTTAEVAAQKATEELEGAIRNNREVIEATGGSEALAGAVRLLDRIDELDRQVAGLGQRAATATAQLEAARAERAGAEEACEALEAEDAAAASAGSKAAEALAAAEDALHAARHEAMAVALRKDLAAGDTCPVCAQTVATVPAVGKAAAIDRAELELEEARTRADAAQQHRTRAAAELAAGVAQLAGHVRAVAAAVQAVETSGTELEAAHREVTAARAELHRLLPVDDPAGEIEQRRRMLDESAALVESKRVAEGAARSAVDEIRSRQQQLAGELVQLATTVATLAGQLGGDLRPGADAVEIEDALGQLRKLWGAAQEETEQERQSAQAQAVAATAALEELRESLGITGQRTISDVRQDAAAAHGQLVGRVDSLTSRVSRFEELEAGSADMLAQLATYSTLAEDLLPARFMRFILDEERRALAALGSEHFERMTRGRYRFTDDGTFNIIDLTSAETERKPESLSGGETFLASLSLALALAEMVSRTGGRLDAFFLDEGFGSLDPEHLDLAMEGIEALVGGNRLVAVVSHVAELRERVEDLIELSTDPITGDTVVVRA